MTHHYNVFRKNCLIFILLSIYSVINLNIFAQEIPNAGFENWETKTSSLTLGNYQDPTNWSTLNFIASSVTPSTDAYSGTYSARLQSVPFDFTSIVPDLGIITTSELITGDFLHAVDSQGDPYKGFAFTRTPKTLSFYYKYTPVANDTAFVSVKLKHWNSDLKESETIGKGTIQISSLTTEWTKATFNINYYNSEIAPDSCVIDITSSISGIAQCGGDGPGPSLPGSVFLIDDLNFGYIEEITQDSIPNNDFENWETKTSPLTLGNYQDPTNWSTLNFIASSVTPSTDAYSGKYSARLQSVPFDFTSIVPDLGIITTSELITGDFLSAMDGKTDPYKGFAFTKTPKTLSFYYKYTPVANDTAFVSVKLKHWNSDLKESETIGKGTIKISSLTTKWTKAIFNINYYNSGVSPDSCVIDITSSISGIAQCGGEGAGPSLPGSVFLIDDLNFGYIEEITQNSIPNNDFENWNNYTSTITGKDYSEPDSWGSINGLLQTPTVQYSSDAENGKYSALLTSHPVNLSLYKIPVEEGQEDWGTITSGDLITGSFMDAMSNGQPTWGFPCSATPYSLTFWYKYIPVGNDKAFVSIRLSNKISDPENYVGKAYMLISSTVNEWTQAELVINYSDNLDSWSHRSTGLPDSCLIALSSSYSRICPNTSYPYPYDSQYLHGGNEGSQLYIDNLQFKYSADNITSATDKRPVSFNKEDHSLTITEDGIVNLFSIEGRLIQSKFVKSNTIIPLQTLGKGLFIIKFSGQKSTESLKIIQ